MYTFWGLSLQTVVQLFHIAFSSLYSMLQSSEVGLYKWFCLQVQQNFTHQRLPRPFPVCMKSS
uniref:Uncharacterized protein n=1 Tax=Anguilla anguilla TaxID=7936 RepID=A0A0E9X3G4_ANGAN